MLNRGLLGWRQPRANDYQGPDSRPLKDSFASIQQYMTWPHFGVTIDASQATTNGLTKKTITPVEDPYELVRNSSDEIQVPRDFDRWLFNGTASAIIDVTGPARVVLGWFLNGANTFIDADDETHIPAGWGSARVSSTLTFPLRKSDVLSVAIYSDPNGSVSASGGRAWGYFLPMA